MDDLLALQEKAVVTLLYASDNDKGRLNTDPVVKNEITEGRIKLIKNYSCCADVAHWSYQQMGFDHPHINRQSLGHYTIGYNIVRLGQLATEFGEHPKGTTITMRLPPTTVFMPGDVFVVWSRQDTWDSHAICVVSDTTDETGKRTITTVEGGQAAPKVIRKYDHVPTITQDAIMIGKRTARYVIRFDQMVKLLVNV